MHSFPLSEELSTLLARYVYWKQIPSVPTWENIYLSLIFKGKFQMTQNSKFIILSITLKIFHSSSLHVFWGETEFLSLLFYRWGTFFLPSVSFKIEKKIIFIFLYLQFEYNMPRCSYFDIYPTWYSLRFLDMWFSVWH